MVKYNVDDLGLMKHNKKTFLNVMKHYRNLNKIAVIQATGTGKGYLASAFIKGPFSDSRIVIVIPNNTLKENYETNFGISDDSEIDYLDYIKDDKDKKRVKIITYHKLLSMSKDKDIINKESNLSFNIICNKCDFIIFDEFHRGGAEKWGPAVKEVMDRLDSRGAKVLGLTATPVRYNDQAIKNDVSLSEQERYEKSRARDMSDEFFGENVIIGCTLEEAIYQNILPSFQYVIGSYGYESEIDNIYDKIDDLSDTGGSMDKRQLEKYLDRLEQIGLPDLNIRNIIRETLDKCNIGENQKWIVFCSDETQLEEIGEELEKWFGKPMNDYIKTRKVDNTKLNLYTLYNKQGNKVNDENLKAFFNGSSGLHIIKVISMLNEGVHVGDVTGAIMLRKTSSPIVYLQQIGRTLSAGKEGTPIVFDLVGNFEQIKNISNGLDETVSIITNASQHLREMNKSSINTDSNGEEIPRGSKYPSIKIVNKVKELNELFTEIDKILKHKNSIRWNEKEIEILMKYYPRGGSASVHRELSRRFMSPKSEISIDQKAKSLGIEFIGDMMTSGMSWSNREKNIVLDAYENLKEAKRRGKNISERDVLFDLSRTLNRSPETIRNFYNHNYKNSEVYTAELEPKNSRKAWTKEDLDKLIKGYSEGKEIQELAKELGRSYQSIQSKVKILKLNPKNSVFSWNQELEMILYNEYKEFYKNNNNVPKVVFLRYFKNKYLVEQEGVTESSIAKKLERVVMKEQAKNRNNVNKKNNLNDKWTPLEEKAFDRCVESDMDWESFCNYFYSYYKKDEHDLIVKLKKEYKKWYNIGYCTEETNSYYKYINYLKRLGINIKI